MNMNLITYIVTFYKTHNSSSFAMINLISNIHTVPWDILNWLEKRWLQSFESYPLNSTERKKKSSIRKPHVLFLLIMSKFREKTHIHTHTFLHQHVQLSSLFFPELSCLFCTVLAKMIFIPCSIYNLFIFLYVHKNNQSF